MARRTGLGRGLEALFADLAPIDPNEREDIDAAANEAAANTDAKAEKPAKKTTKSGAKSTATANKKEEKKSGAKTGTSKSGTAKATARSTGKAGSKAADKTGSAPSGKGTAAKSGAKRGAVVNGNNADISADDENRVVYIDINDIKPNREQPRTNFDEAKLQELADSIISNGMIQPIVVRRSSNGYELVAGERRWRASRVAGLTTVPCIVRDFTDEQNVMIAIIENMQREDLNPIEEAAGLQNMMKKLGMTQEEASRAVGKSRAYVANSLRLLNLPEEIQAKLEDGTMSAAHGRALAGVTDEKKRAMIADRIVKEGLSVRATEKLAAGVSGKAVRRRKKAAEKPQDVLTAEDELRRIVGTKVNIIGDRSTGKIEIEYYSLDELNRLIELFRTLD